MANHEWTCRCGYHNGAGMSASPLSCVMCGRSRYAPIPTDAPGFTGTATITLNLSETPNADR